MRLLKTGFEKKWLLVPAVLALAWGLLPPSDAFANISLKKLQVTDGSQIDLLFDGKLEPKQIKTEFINDIIQLSMTDVSVYPAKIFSVSGTELTKVFAYQYAPKVVRCRLTVKGKAQDYQNRFQYKMSGKMLTLRIKDESEDQIVQSSAAPARAAQVGTQPQSTGGTADSKANAQPNTADVKMSSEDKAVLDHVMKGTPGAAADDRKDGGKKEQRENAKAEGSLGSNGNLAGGKALPSPVRSLVMLAVVLVLFGGLALILKKGRQQDGTGKENIAGFLGKFIRNGLGRKEKMIEVVANHYLGPKKNIVVVRVGGQMLVLGVANDSINLITQFPEGSAAARRCMAGSSVEGNAEPESSDFDLEGLTDADRAYGRGDFQGAAAYGEQHKSPFADVLNDAASKPGIPRTGVASNTAASSVRARIRSRLEGMKQL